MRMVQTLTGQKPIILKSFIGISVPRIGVPLVQPGDGEAGVMLGTTTAVDNLVGLAHSTGVYATAQQTDGSDPQAAIDVIVNPDAIFEAKLSGSATDDVALTLRTTLTANSNGLTITTTSGDDWGTPTYAEGAIWGYDGANPGILRKITSVSSNVATVDVAFPADDVAGDNWLYAPVWPYENHTFTLTTNLTQIRQDVAVAVNTAAFVCIELLARDIGENGRTNSYVRMLSGNHIFGGVLN